MTGTTIRSAREGSKVVFAADLDPDEAAFIDRDAVPPTADGPIPAVVVRTGPSDASHALEAFTAVAQAVIEAMESAPPGRVAVGGQGVVAELVRRFLPADRVGSDRPLAGLVDTTGDAPTIERGIEQVCDLGVVVLTADPHGAEPVVDVYRDVHRRGLTLVGLADPSLVPAASGASRVLGESVIDLLQPPHLITITSGEPAPTTARWYRVTSAHANERDA